jgi:hypothetical protein
MKLRALVRDPESIERFLRHENLWSPPPDTLAGPGPALRPVRDPSATDPPTRSVAANPNRG